MKDYRLKYFWNIRDLCLEWKAEWVTNGEREDRDYDVTPPSIYLLTYLYLLAAKLRC